MEKIKNLSMLEMVINNQFDIFEERQGEKYKLNFIILLQKPLIQTITMIKENKLYYQSDY